MIRFYIYDGFGFPANKDGALTYSTDGYLVRKAAIDNAFFSSSFPDRYKDVIKYVKTWIVYSKQELSKVYQTFLEDKQEGAIIRILDKPYENKRSKYLLKYKPVDDAEYRVIAVNEGIGKFSGRVSTFTCQRTDNKKFLDGTDTFNATFKGTEDDAIYAWTSGKAKELIGGVWTIYYNGFTGYGKPNYARLDWENYDKGN
jgi:ATP-dependent DNA ligase